MSPAQFAQSFWSRVDVRGPSECWNWKVAATPQGYARINLGNRVRDFLGFANTNTYAYRVAYRLHHGTIDHSLTVDHTCHDPRCCNPAHLRQCTQSENAKRKWFHVLEERPAHLKPLDQCRHKFRSQVGRQGAA